MDFNLSSLLWRFKTEIEWERKYINQSFLMCHLEKATASKQNIERKQKNRNDLIDKSNLMTHL